MYTAFIIFCYVNCHTHSPSHRDQVLNQKYEEFIRLMANWRELITIQSDDRLQVSIGHSGSR